MCTYLSEERTTTWNNIFLVCQKIRVKTWKIILNDVFLQPKLMIWMLSIVGADWI